MRNKMRFGIIMGIIICGLLTMGIVSAEIDETNLGSVKQNTCIEIPQVCGSCSYVNLTIYYPNKSRAITNDGMTSIGGSSWNYEFCNTSNLGKYYISGGGDVEGSLTGFDNYYFEVTPSGFNWGTGFYIILFILSFGIILLGYKIEDEWIVMLGSFALIIIGLLMLFYGINDIRDSVYTWALSIITLMLGAYFSVKAGIEAIN